MSVVQYSTSFNSSFISTVDHLPADIVRSLWAVQSLNIKVEKHRQELHKILLDAQCSKIDRETLRCKYIEAKNAIAALQLEAIQETKALYNQVVTHRWFLAKEAEQLKTIKNNLLDSDATNVNLKMLREKVKTHYKEHPLKSQREALKEQQLKKSFQTERAHGLKIRLKLSPSTSKKRSIATPGAPTRLRKVLRRRDHVKPTNVLPKVTTKTKSPKRTKSRVANIKPKDQRKNSKQRIKSSSKTKYTQEFVPSTNDSVLIEQEDNQAYCFCKQPSFGNMIACDNEDTCPNGEWFHYKCVGLLNRVEALKFTSGQQKWFCSDFCREQYETKAAQTISTPEKATAPHKGSTPKSKKRKNHNK